MVTLKQIQTQVAELREIHNNNLHVVQLTLIKGGKVLLVDDFINSTPSVALTKTGKFTSHFKACNERFINQADSYKIVVTKVF